MSELNNEQVEELFEKEEQKDPNAVQKFGPVLMLSLAGHLVLLFFISLIPPQEPRMEKVIKIETTIEEFKQETPPEKIEKVVINTEKVDVKTDEIPEKVDDKTVEVDEPVTEEQAVGVNDNDKILSQNVGDSDPTDNMPASIGVGNLGGDGGGKGFPTGFNGRDKIGKNKNRNHFKGQETAKPLARALEWLANHQEADGSWDVTKYEGTEATMQNPCPAVAPAITTGIALLAFLGDGHSEISGEYKKNVKAGLKYINKALDDDKARTELYYGNNYGTAIMLMALSEATILGASSKTRENADRLAEWFIRCHKGQKAGWRYQNAADSDLSVSGWVALALKDAKTAELPSMMTKEAMEALEIYKTWVDKTMTNYEGEAGYTGSFQTHTQTMAYVGMFSKHFLGFGKADGFNTNAALKYGTPQAIDACYKLEEPGNVYMIYYGTLSAFQQSGQFWDNWNPIMKRRLIGSQCPGSTKEMGGSWNPTKDHTGQQGGRVFTTAMLALCLEVYYRFGSMSGS
jgi:hypothetical protein